MVAVVAYSRTAVAAESPLTCHEGLLLSLIVSFANFLIFLPMHDNGLFGAGNGQDHSNWFWVFVLLNNFV